MLPHANQLFFKEIEYCHFSLAISMFKTHMLPIYKSFKKLEA